MNEVNECIGDCKSLMRRRFCNTYWAIRINL